MHDVCTGILLLSVSIQNNFYWSGGGGSTSKKTQKNPKNPNPKMEITGNVGFFGFYFYIEKNMENAFLDIP